VTDLCDPPSGDDCRDGERDAPAIANMPSIWRWLRALSSICLRPALRRKRRHRAIRLHRLNDYMLKDIGLIRTEDNGREHEGLHPLMLPFRRNDGEDD